MPVRHRQRNLRRAPLQLIQIYNEWRAKRAYLRGIGDLYNHNLEGRPGSSTISPQTKRDYIRNLSRDAEKILQVHEDIKTLEDKLDTLSCLYKYPLGPELNENVRVYEHLPNRDTHPIDEETFLPAVSSIDRKNSTKKVSFVEPMVDIKEVWKIRAGNRDGRDLLDMTNKVLSRTGKSLSTWLGTSTWKDTLLQNTISSDTVPVLAETTTRKIPEVNPLKRVHPNDDCTYCERPLKRLKSSHESIWPEAYAPFDIFSDLSFNTRASAHSNQTLNDEGFKEGEEVATKLLHQPYPDNPSAYHIKEPVCRQRHQETQPVQKMLDKHCQRRRYLAELHNDHPDFTDRTKKAGLRLTSAV